MSRAQFRLTVAVVRAARPAVAVDARVWQAVVVRLVDPQPVADGVPGHPGDDRRLWR